MPKNATLEVIENVPVTTITDVVPVVPATVPVRPQQSLSPIAAMGGDDSWDDVDAGAFRVPRLSIVQPASRRDGAEDHAGQFFRNTDSSYHESLDVVILKQTPNNTLWGAMDSKVPECVSTDGRTGSVYGACGSCQFNRFGSSPASAELNRRLEKGENIKHCQTGGRNFVVVTRDDDEIALFGVHGKNIGPMHLLNTSIKGKGIPMYGAPVTLQTRMEKNAKGRFYVLTPTVGKKFTPEELAEWRPRFEALRGVTVTDVGPDPEDAMVTTYGDPVADDVELAF